MVLLEKITIFIVIIIGVIFNISYAVSIDDLIKENDQLSFLEDYKDSREMILLKIKQLEEINKSRKSYGLNPIKLDLLACRVANKHCEDMLNYNFMGHWNQEGYKPYHRYSLAGGIDHVGENIAAQWVEGATYSNNSENIIQMMNVSHKQFMAEISPKDWHKKQVLLPYHTHAGIGVSINQNSFRYVQLYIDRYVNIEPIPKINNDIVLLKGKMLPDKYLYAPYLVIIYYEKIPKHFNYKEQPSSYPDYSNERYLTIPPWRLNYDQKSKQFEVVVPLKKNVIGSYYIQLYVRDRIDTIPYELKPGIEVSVNTKDAIPATGIVFFINS